MEIVAVNDPTMGILKDQPYYYNRTGQKVAVNDPTMGILKGEQLAGVGRGGLGLQSTIRRWGY